ncbi:BEM_collapsed_G0016640.mRNA.1.CDS.1 [Saccharomyces cerevisiae]|nr:BEM_collapsed_G0016640.mRNA.1.CDS.1 [Saccharomyces cerevisiae]
MILLILYIKWGRIQHSRLFKITWIIFQITLDLIHKREDAWKIWMSLNALPHFVDCVMKSIYRTSVFVNDSNLMTRTKEAIGLSKKVLKS